MTITEPRTRVLPAEELREHFPIFSRPLRDGRRLVYLDSGATTQKPRVVLDAERDFYTTANAAAHRGVHELAGAATEVYEGARTKVATFLGVNADEIVFTKNATEAINLVAYALGGAGAAAGSLALKPGDEVVVTEMEHHANLIPWQQACARSGARLRWFGLTDEGRLDLAGLEGLLTERTRLVAVTHQSNVLGTVNPIRLLADAAHRVGALLLVDAAQSVPHQPVDLSALGADFAVLSAHKLCGPFGIGVLYGRTALLDGLPPFLTGGSMIVEVTMTGATFRPPPHRFEPGVPPVAQAAGLAAAIGFLDGIGLPAIAEHEATLTAYAMEQLSTLPGIRILGPRDIDDRGAAISFTVEGVHAHDVGQVLDDMGVAVRTGNHCARPLMKRYGVAACTRATPYLYNTLADIETLVEGVEHAQRIFGNRRGAGR
jgi:cysteine desulfurase/selenocysteine lyase